MGSSGPKVGEEGRLASHVMLSFRKAAEGVFRSNFFAFTDPWNDYKKVAFIAVKDWVFCYQVSNQCLLEAARAVDMMNRKGS